jgi:hypothetical protein
MEDNCTFEGCVKQIKAKGLCEAHYFQRRRGVTLKPLREYRAPTVRDSEGKTCKGCNQHKKLEEYHVSKRAKDGRQTWCKPCQVAKVKAQRKAKQLASAN